MREQLGTHHARQTAAASEGHIWRREGLETLLWLQYNLA